MIKLGKETEQHWSVEEISVTEPTVMRRAVAAAAIGNITEWYDFGVYAYLETTIQKVFFDNLSDTMAAVTTFGVFAAAFLVRPFGGLFFGPLADRIGRNRVLATTMIMMALGTFCIGIIPERASIGLAAPLLLLVCRFIQGFSTGGEYGNAMTFIAEYAPDRKRGFLGSWLECGTFTGYLLGAIVATVATTALSDDQLLSWGWRVPFFVALPLGIVGVYLRTRLGDTPAFQALESQAAEQEKRTEGEFATLRRLWPSMLVCIGLVLAWNVPNYLLTSYMPTYVTQTAPEALHKAATSETFSQVLQIIVMAVLLLLIPFLGMLADRVGVKPIVWAGSAALVVLAFPSVLLVQSGASLAIFVGLLMMGLALICFSATMPSTLPGLFPTRVRSGGLSIAFNVSVSLFGGSTSFVVGSLVGATGDLNWPAYYMIVTGIIGAVAIFLTPEPRGRVMWGSAPAAESRREAEELATA